MVKSPKRPPRPGKRPQRARTAAVTQKKEPTKDPTLAIATPVAPAAPVDLPKPKSVEVKPTPEVIAISANAPDETGMLRLNSMDFDDGEEEVAKSATQFFMRPPPKAPAKKPVAPPVSSAITSSAGGQRAASGAQGSVGPAGITGPTAGGPAPMGGNLASHATLDAPPDQSGQRKMVLIGLLLAFLLFAVTAIGGLVYWKSSQEGASEEVVAEKVERKVPEQRNAEPVEDTAASLKVVANPAPVKRKKSAPKSTRSASSTKSSATSSRTPKKRRPSGSGAFTLTLKGVTHTSAQLRCESGTSDKQSFRGESVTFSKVDASGCRVTLKGGADISYSNGVVGNNKLTCTYASKTKIACK
jgi:hypothetical protein